MKPYVIKGVIIKQDYMSEYDYDTKIEEIRIVMANDIDEAIEKYKKYWASKSVEYSESFFITMIHVEETLV